MNTNRGLTTNNDRILKLEAEVVTMQAEQADLLRQQAEFEGAILDIRAALLESKQKVSR